MNDAGLGPLFEGIAPARPARPLPERLAALVRALRAAPGGLSTAELARANGSMAIHSDVAELREKGFKISCAREGRTETGRHIFRYRLEGGPT